MPASALFGRFPTTSIPADRLRSRSRRYIHNVHGQTEHVTIAYRATGPAGTCRRRYGVISVGIPVCNTMVHAVDDNGEEVPVGAIGELVTSGPQAISQYWDNLAATAAALAGVNCTLAMWVPWMPRAGSVGRPQHRRDQCRRVQRCGRGKSRRVLLSHPLVRDAAVVAIPDDYRDRA